MKSLRKALSEIVFGFGNRRSERVAHPASSTSPEDEGAPLTISSKRSLGLSVIVGRLLAFICGAAALYLAVGSWMFPGWFFGFVWRGKVASLAYLGTGVSYWLDEHPGTLAWAIATTTVLLIVAFSYRRMFLPFVDRFRFRLASAFIGILVLTAVLDYRYGRSEYEVMEMLQQLTASMQLVVGQVFSIGRAPAIQPPVSFQYLDRVHVENLYNQIEPELIEKKRTVVSGQSAEGKGNLSADEASAELSAGKKSEATSSFERSASSPARKCEELMRFVLEQGRAHFYTDGADWYIRASSVELKAMYDKAVRDARNPEETKSDLEQLGVAPHVPQTAGEKRAADARMKLHEMELNAELSSLSGLVFVDALFDVHRPGKGNLVLTEVFTEKPRRVTFRIVGLKAGDLQSLTGKMKAHLRIFGDVREPLSEEGVVEIGAIAVY